MSGNYEIWLTSDVGSRLAQLDSFTSLEASRVVNGIGNFNLTMPLSFDPELIQPDRMVQISRQSAGGKQGLWRVYFVRRWKFSTVGSRQVVEFSGPDVNDLLRRRIVAAYAGSSQALKTSMAVDDLMKEVVSESILDSAAPVPAAGTRAWANLSVAPNLTAGPVIDASFPFEKLLTTSNQGILPGLAETARFYGTEVFFDIVPNVVTSTGITFQFQTFTGQPGQDVSGRVTFDQASGSMREPSLEYDYSEEANYVYALGQGEQADLNVQQVYDATRYGVSIWARCEDFIDARGQVTDLDVTYTGAFRLDDGRPKIRFTATPVDTPAIRFGRDWDVGYKVGVKFLNRQFNSIIRATTLLVNKDGEKIQARLDFEDVI